MQIKVDRTVYIVLGLKVKNPLGFGLLVPAGEDRKWISYKYKTDILRIRV